jgi:ABC-type uncharacterized transport system substrate-binding protein
MRRREFIALLGSAAAWPLAARAQQADRVRRIGVLTGITGDDPEAKPRIAAFLQELQRLGWTEGRNVQIEIREGTGNVEVARKNAAELVALVPDVILSTGAGLAPLLDATRTVPIVFTLTVDPVGGGFVDSLARPGGNMTGFMMFEYSLSGKWLELLKQIAPGVTRAAVLRDPINPAGIGQFAVIQAMAPSLGIDVSAINVRDAREIERAIAAFANSTNGGLVVTASPLTVIHRDLIITLAARHKLPTVYWDRSYVIAGGLISYGADVIKQHRLAAGYVDRILKGEKPAELPVQTPTNYELVINLKTAKAFGLTVPPSLLARADEVIE